MLENECYRYNRRKNGGWIDENMYLKAQIDTYKRYNNKGERDEVLAILKLIYLNYTENYEELIKIFGDDASEGIKVLDTTLSHIPKRNIYDIKKTISSYKADCVVIMNKTGKTWAMSIKSKNGANPTILNHTPRTAKVFQKKEN